MRNSGWLTARVTPLIDLSGSTQPDGICEAFFNAAMKLVARERQFGHWFASAASMEATIRISDRQRSNLSLLCHPSTFWAERYIKKYRGP